MPVLAPKTRRFISAVRRRVIFIRMVESVGIALAFAAIAALVLLPVLWWRGQSAMPLVGVALALGLLCGIIRGISRKPTLVSVAIETDRQLQLDDLLGSVISLSRQYTDERHAEELSTPQWVATLVALAERQSATLTPTKLLIRRLNGRAWSGIGLSLALLLTLGLLTGQPGGLQASSVARLTPVSDAQSSIVDDPQTRSHADDANNGRPAGSSNIDEASNRSGNGEQHPDDDATGKTPAADSTQSARNSSGTRTGSGVGMATTDARLPHAPLQPAEGGSHGVRQGDADSGNGAADATARHGAGSPGGQVTPGNGRLAPPWQSDHWPSDRQHADESIRSGQVPDEDSDLVREYFRKDF